MKNWLSLAFALGIMGIAHAAPYIVFSGTITGTNYNSAGAASDPTVIYILTDLADTSHFAVLFVDKAGKTYSVIARPSDSPAFDESVNNFIGDLGTSGKSASVIISYSAEAVDANNNTFVVRTHANGSLLTKDIVLVPARTKALAVKVTSGGAVTGTTTFPVSAALSTGVLPYATSFSGESLGYTISAAGELTTATTSGTVAMKESSAVTGLANIGGPVKVGSTTTALKPVVIPSGTTTADAYAEWLISYAQASGYSSSAPAVSK